MFKIPSLRIEDSPELAPESFKASSPEFSRDADLPRYRPGQKTGFYESFFSRANHPDRPLAFWIRCTLFSPIGRPDDAVGELWAVLFDGETRRNIAVKTEIPLQQCDFNPETFSVRIGEALLEQGRIIGSAASGGHHISWQLRFSGDEAPLLLLPPAMYQMAFPKAKSLVSLPMARHEGFIAVDDRRIEVNGWIGSRNHNWGERHTDRYAWGQVAGFDTHPDVFLEVATASVKIGPIWSPRFTPLVLRRGGSEMVLNSPLQMLRARGSFCFFVWTFRTESQDFLVEGTVSAPREAFVGLRYANPPGGSKTCLNTKLAACELQLTDKKTGKKEILFTRHRAAFEILTDEHDHGIDVKF